MILSDETIDALETIQSSYSDVTFTTSVIVAGCQSCSNSCSGCEGSCGGACQNGSNLQWD